jgi:hypothetical protein
MEWINELLASPELANVFAIATSSGFLAALYKIYSLTRKTQVQKEITDELNKMNKKIELIAEQSFEQFEVITQALLSANLKTEVKKQIQDKYIDLAKKVNRTVEFKEVIETVIENSKTVLDKYLKK